jgi:hypothetical protein
MTRIPTAKNTITDFFIAAPLGRRPFFAPITEFYSAYEAEVATGNLKTIARALKPDSAQLGFPVRKKPIMTAHPGGMRPRSPQRLT